LGRKEDRVALAEGLFTDEEELRIHILRNGFMQHRDCFNLDVSLRQLEFMRWLVQRGYFEDDADSCGEASPRAGEMRRRAPAMHCP
jgi:hypothetical protein